MSDEKKSIEETLEELLKLAKEGKLSFVTLLGLIDEDEDKTGCIEYVGTRDDELEINKLLIIYSTMSDQVKTLRKVIKALSGKEVEEVQEGPTKIVLENRGSGKILH